MKKGTGLDAFLRQLLLLMLALTLAGCDGGDAEVSSVPKPAPAFDPAALELTDEALIAGREVWLETCAKCHIRGLGGAPKIADQADWAPRIAKGKAVLYDHAINGFTGPLLNEMPPKGGFTELTDEQVKLAVDFVVFASK